MLPRWAYGFWQSRQRYETQDQLLGVLREYRRRDLPLDNIVQDWRYWPEDSWGCHCFDPTRFPDAAGDGRRSPRAQRADHDLGLAEILSDHRATTSSSTRRRRLPPHGRAAADEPTDANYIQGMYATGSAPAIPTPSTIRTTRKRARSTCARSATRWWPSGFDAWWLDCDEPDIHSNLSIAERARRMGPTAIGPGRGVLQLLPAGARRRRSIRTCVEHAPDTRPFILTRSGFGGIQRAGAALWSGDVAARWDDLRDQISAGVNISMSGVPNWTHDIGGFALEDRYTKQDPAHVAEWRELNLRWFQFGAFSPLFRSHGEFPYREIYEIAAGRHADATSRMVFYDRLRYRLMPYIYTLAADTWQRDGTIMRGLVMDFPRRQARRGTSTTNICSARPSWSPRSPSSRRAAARSICRRATTWYDFYTGRAYAGRAGRSRPRRLTSGCRCSCAPARSCRPARRSSRPREIEPDQPDHAASLHRRRRQLLALRGRRADPPAPQGRLLAHSDPLRRKLRRADDRRARGQLAGNGRASHVQRPLDERGRAARARPRRAGRPDHCVRGPQREREAAGLNRPAMRALLLLLAAWALGLATPALAAGGSREALTLSAGWLFAKGDPPGAAEPGFDDATWTRTTLPHTFNAGETGEGDYYRGPGWYRRAFEIATVKPGRRLYVAVRRRGAGRRRPPQRPAGRAGMKAGMPRSAATSPGISSRAATSSRCGSTIPRPASSPRSAATSPCSAGCTGRSR